MPDPIPPSRRTPSSLAIGLRPPQSVFEGGRELLGRVVARAEALGIDHLCTGDHVSFHGGLGFDGLIQLTALALLSRRLPVHATVYLLPLRHPFPVARQVATLAQLAPGRIALGVGIGGEDPGEVENCGVDPRTRGRRMDECLEVLVRLLRGESLDFEGAFFRLRAARILPAPEPAVPILVGGRSPAALRRAARFGQGWHAVFVAADRFAKARAEVESIAAAAGRGAIDWRHGLQVWCGFDRSREAAIPRLAASLEAFYKLPFERFARYAPAGTAADVAAALAPYAAAGCRNLNLIPIAADPDAAVEGVAEVRRLLLGST
jgi:alkanesulfonate monooxygenase SsuD/methylene tetrahydromethanopterin reductase-like flavin-dependent oxidoreductase (luciferase family)